MGSKYLGISKSSGVRFEGLASGFEDHDGH